MGTRGLNRERLVEIAHDFVSANGLDALTMRRLAVAAHVTPGALYKHVHGKRDLQRAMADAVYATVDLSDIDLSTPTVDQVITCCARMREAMLRFRDGARIVAGSYSPFAATANIAGTLRALLQAVTAPQFDAGDIAYALRNYTTGFVIEEQAYLALKSTGEWEHLVEALEPDARDLPGGMSDAVVILTDDRDKRYLAGLIAILTGTVNTRLTEPG
ncbi:MAG TPA: TetR/AcrR family transcriptional regulator C-terminal domain-containing protein [Jatrophihabitantaceae bacterium]|jgi:TetR/AcrR family tetracycline transcriptional repressor|nr:TetR/AcrR family transcriptional regulator C-terminal domain-containing protein [Jatrophihabitantaceae bacterium]